MAITRVKKLVGRETPESEDGTREYIEKYIVLADSKDDVGATIRRASFGGVTVPAIDDQYPGDSGARVRRVRAREEATNGVNVWKWIVEVEYSTAETSGSSSGGGGDSDDPTDMRWTRRWSTRSISRPVEKAVWIFEGTEFPENPIATSPLGEVFDPGIEEDECVAVLTIIRNQLNFSSTTFAYLNKCNSSQFYGFAIGEARMANIEAAEKFRGDLVYAEVTFEIEFKQGGWDREILNQGYWYNDANNNAVKTDKETLRLIDRQTGYILAPGEAQYVTFRTKQRVDFGPLNLE